MLWFSVQLQLLPTLTLLLSIASILLNVGFYTKLDSKIPTSKYIEDEINALTQFREIVNDTLDKDYERTDTFLMPWLRASNLNFVAATDMLRAAKKWRKDYRMDTILNETVLELKTKPCVLDGVDKEGSPIALLNSGNIDIRKWVLFGKLDEVTRYITKCLERTLVKIRRLAKITGKDITQSVIVIDFNGYSIKQHGCISCVRIYLDFFRSAQNYYPLLAKHLVIINVPMIAKPLIEMSKGIISSNTLRALKVFGTNKKEWSEYLLQIIPVEQLPIKYGGTRETQYNDSDYD